MCACGRPYIYGLALGGEEGVKHVLRALCGEVVVGMHLAGLRSLEEVDRDILVRDDELFQGSDRRCRWRIEFRDIINCNVEKS